ncbi:TPA: hypothetical protein HA338_12905 [Methanosarcina acetivorans]|uniref:Uncharacterized protein n=1 Tax=Methanosarcina acetivorans TaxID=2214 RepID=A0A832SKF7_9EURY|nr:hypothetical protein [Methanosarcina acetivorans]HIH94870.1 hypothetical protein [Methanosarcina acetivorans]
MVKKTETKTDDRTLLLLESLLLLFIVLWGLKAIVKLFGESIGLYTGLVDDLFFFLYWCIGIYFIFRLNPSLQTDTSPGCP